MLKNNKGFIITIIFIIICFVGSSILMFVANEKFSETLRETGGEIPQKIKDTQEAFIEKNDALLKSIAMKLTESKKDDSIQITIDDLRTMFDDYEQILGLDNVKMYAVINNEFYSFDDVEYIMDYRETEWYKMAMETSGNEIIYTDAHLYNGTDENVITSAIRLEDSDDIIAINIFPERITTWTDIEIFPEGTCYYITDSKGKIIHQDNSDPEVAPDETKEYISEIYTKTYSNKSENLDSLFLKENKEENVGFYTTETYNGWKIFVMIPYEEILSDIKNILVMYYIATVVFSILMFYLALSERKATRGKALYNRITKALGDSYYALYLVDFAKEKYIILKGSEYMKEAIPKTGDYNVFMDCMEAVMEKEAYKEFKKSFSIQNIRRLIKNNISTFGGDFKREFNGKYKWVNVQMLYSEDSIKKQKPEVIFAFQDVDKKKQKELEEKEVLIESLDTMQLATKSKNRFFANMSHDMRTPLNAIINLSNLAKSQINNKEKLLDYLKKINISSTQLLELINNILEVSKIEENMPLINKVEIDISEKLRDTLSVFEEQANLQNKKLEIACNIKHNYVLCDWGKVRQIINNIVSNALKYTRADGHIIIEINEIEGKFVSKYEFKVTDNGIGMSKEFLKKIYTPFERETRFHSEEMNGTGLGMSIVQSNVQKLNGQIEIKSEPGKGSEVRVVIPLEICKEMEHNDKKEEENLQDLTGIKILLVEDNELNMEIATEILEMQGVKITQAFDGKQALDIFSNSIEGYFDAILMDIQMPIMDGYETTKAIRKLHRKDAKSVIILAVTANTFAEDIIAAEKAGMNAHIAKPIDFKELQKVLTKFMGEDNV